MGVVTSYEVKRSRKPAKPVSAETIARLADHAKDISGFFKKQGRMIRPKLA
jgi:hypothetical protein